MSDPSFTSGGIFPGGTPFTFVLRSANMADVIPIPYLDKAIVAYRDIFSGVQLMLLDILNVQLFMAENNLEGYLPGTDYTGALSTEEKTKLTEIQKRVCEKIIEKEPVQRRLAYEEKLKKEDTLLVFTSERPHLRKQKKELS